MSLDITLYNNTCDKCGRGDYVWDGNITHNLGTMAEEAGIYRHVWRPEEIGIQQARELVEPLSFAIKEMKTNPDRFRKLDPENGWGCYNDFVPWLTRYLEACRDFPRASIRVCR